MELYPYQEEAVRFANERGSCALFLPMGMGKTAIALRIIRDYIKGAGANKRVLVIAPLSVANTEWRTQPTQWEHDMSDYAYCLGSTKAKKQAIESNKLVTITNRDNVVWITKHYEWQWSMVIIDESSSFKSPKTLRTKAIKRVLGRIDRMILLSGTPTPNSLLDLYTQIYFIDKGERLGRTYGQYVSTFFYRAGYMGYDLKPHPRTPKVIEARLKDICFSLKQEHYVKLPRKIVVDYAVPFNNKERSLYKKLAKNYLIELDSKPITILSAASLTNKLLQVCNGNIYDQDGKTNHIHKVKLDYLEELLENNPNENFLVAYNYISDKEALLKHFPYAKLLDNKGNHIKAWNDGDIRLLITHPKTSAYGLNLQAGGRNIIWYGITWNYELYTQFNARLHRHGQNRPVKIYHLIIKDTIENKVLTAINKKHTTQKALLDSLIYELRADIK